MQEIHSIRPRHYATSRYVYLMLIFLMGLTLPARAKTTVDFDPDVDFSKFKTFAFIGPVQNLVEIQMNADLINTRMHDMVVRELGKKGLHEVNLNQNPDLVVRYWTVPESQVNVATMGNWAPYSAYIDGHWNSMYSAVPASGKRDTTLILDLIQTKTKSLAWRTYLTRKLSDPDRDWKKADEEFTDAFKSYPPSEKPGKGKQPAK